MTPVRIAAYLPKQRGARCAGWPFLDRDQTDCRLTIAGQDDFVPRLGPADEFRQLGLRFGNGNTHVEQIDQMMVQVKKSGLLRRLAFNEAAFLKPVA